MRILIVDDSEDGRELAEVMLIAAGYEDVSAAASAMEAYRFLGIGETAAQQPAAVDLILLDVVMPGIDGIEACARIRSEQRYSSVPIIMVTSLADADSLANAFVAGATDYVTKPVSRIELLARVRSALKLKAELDRREAREHQLLQVMSASGDRRSVHWMSRRPIWPPTLILFPTVIPPSLRSPSTGSTHVAPRKARWSRPVSWRRSPVRSVRPRPRSASLPRSIAAE
jgi:DNA-binding response OmpR family regulator